MTGILTWADVLIGAWSVILGGFVLVVDARSHRIPNRLTVAWAVGVVALGCGFGIGGRWGDVLASVLTGIALFAVGYLVAVISPDAFGFGDVKLLGCVGLSIGYLDPQLVVVWLLGLAVGTLVWLVLARWLDRQYDRGTPLRKRQIAFGPPIIIGLALTYIAVLVAM